MSTLKVNTIQNTSGVEVYTAKAWVNFNGTGTVAIRASGNVSSITDGGTGDYYVNFTTAIQDTNYCVVASISNASAGANAVIPTNNNTTPPTTGSIRIGTYIYAAATDPTYCFVAIFR